MTCVDHVAVPEMGARVRAVSQSDEQLPAIDHAGARGRRTQPTPRDNMADNRQWRSVASSRVPKRIASGARKTHVTLASAKQSHARYLELAREAQRIGDRIEAENWLQHAEHFFRVMQELSAAPHAAE